MLCTSLFYQIVVSPQADKSVEVQIIGTKICSLRHVELIRSVDDLYNNMANINGNQGMKACASNHQSVDKEKEVIDLSQTAAEELFAKNDLVILQPKNPLILPLVPNNRFAVSESDIKNHIAIVELAYTRGLQKYCPKSVSCFLFFFLLIIVFDLCFVLFFCQELRC